MRSSHRTQGATLIVSLLFVMLILAVIMSVTAQVTLSTRRSSADQQRLLGARYAAESGVAQVQARLRVMKALMDDATIAPTVGNSVVEARLRDLCGGAALPPAASAPTDVCTFPASGLMDSPTRVSLFQLAVGADRFREQGFRSVSDQDRARFWMSLFSGAGGTLYQGNAGTASAFEARFGLRPTRLERDGNTYRLHFTVPSLSSSGVSGAASQSVRARATGTGAESEYVLLIQRPPFARYALFTNHHFQSPEAEASGGRINFTKRTLFSGPVHSNQHFLFEGDMGPQAGHPVFWGEVTSVGCPKGGIGTDPATGKPACVAGAQPGAYFDATAQTFVDAATMTPSPDAPVSGDNAPQFRNTVTWNADYVPLPTNNQNQNAAAISGGLYLSGNVTELQLWRDIIGGAERQRVTYRQEGRLVQLSYGEDRRLWLWDDAAAAWVPAGRAPDGRLSASGAQTTFNGVISVEGGGIDNLNGGPRAGQAGPEGASIASFAGVTVAASGSINVTSSLKYTEPPCSGRNTPAAPATCDRLEAQNILGVYSSTGNIELISPTACPDGDGGCPNIGEEPQIHAVLMASQGAVQVRGWNQGAPQGSVNLIGGIIENYYGAFGQFNAAGPTHGYGRNFVYDQRTYDGFSPPSFPTQTDWTVALSTPDGNDQPLARDGKGIRLQGDSVSVERGGQ